MYKLEVKIDERDPEYAVLKVIDENENCGTWLLNKIKDTYYIISFMNGKINGKIQFGRVEEKHCKTNIKSAGKGRKSKEAWDIIYGIQREAFKNYEEYQY